MRGFVRAPTAGPRRLRVAIVIAVLAIAGAGYVGTQGVPSSLYEWGYHLGPQATRGEVGSWDYQRGNFYVRVTSTPSEVAVRISAAVLLALVGLGLAAGVAGWRRAPRRFGPDEVPRAWR